MSPLMNIVVSNVKGGVGKTTSTIYLAAAAVERGYDPVVLVDADRQAFQSSGTKDARQEAEANARLIGADPGLLEGNDILETVLAETLGGSVLKVSWSAGR